MAVKPIHILGANTSPFLRTKAEDVVIFGAPARQLLVDLTDTAINAGGVGLAANQIGVLKRAIVLRMGEDEDGNPKFYGFLNPRITARFGQQVVPEGCLSIPCRFLSDVIRSLKIRLNWQEDDGQYKEQDFEGFPAAVLQHELDHLDGILYIDHISSLKRQMVLRHLDKWIRAYKKRVTSKKLNPTGSVVVNFHPRASKQDREETQREIKKLKQEAAEKKSGIILTDAE